jgi:Rrf2 family protein
MKGGTLYVREISESLHIPNAFLAKIFNTLAKKQLVATQRGIRGGVSLLKAPESITLYEICEALDEPILKSRCILGLSECSDEMGCPVHHFWAKQLEREIRFLHKTTLADIAEPERLKVQNKEGKESGGNTTV